MKVSEFRKSIDQNAMKQRLEGFKEFLKVQKHLQNFDHCAQCGDTLKFHTEVKKETQMVEEHIVCSSCQSRAPIRSYRLN